MSPAVQGTIPSQLSEKPIFVGVLTHFCGCSFANSSAQGAEHCRRGLHQGGSEVSVLVTQSLGFIFILGEVS